MKLMITERRWTCALGVSLALLTLRALLPAAEFLARLAATKVACMAASSSWLRLVQPGGVAFRGCHVLKKDWWEMCDQQCTTREHELDRQ